MPIGAQPIPGDQNIILTQDGPVATITLNRPERLNALDLPTWQALRDCATGLAADPTVRCVVVQGAGKAFAAGADIAEFDTVRATPQQAKDYDVIMRSAFDAIRDLPVPVVAAISGACVGGGLELACLCDLRICTENSRFGVPINRISVVMAYPEIKEITRLVGPAHTASLLLEGRIIKGPEALHMGLVNRMVADEEALAVEIAQCCEGIVKGAPRANARHKAFLRRLDDPAPISEVEMDDCYDFLETEDYKEGMAAFKAKRPPEFSGR